jgi:hypothetical protein
MQLAGEPQPIGLVARLQLRVQAVRRAEEGDPQRPAEALKPVAQRGQGAVGVQPLASAPPAPARRSARRAAPPASPTPCPGSRWMNVQRLVREDRPLAVEALAADPRVAVGPAGPTSMAVSKAASEVCFIASSFTRLASVVKDIGVFLDQPSLAV